MKRKEWLLVDEAYIYLLNLGVIVSKQMVRKWIRGGKLSKSGKRIYLKARAAGGDPNYYFIRPDWIDKFLEEISV